MFFLIKHNNNALLLNTIKTYYNNTYSRKLEHTEENLLIIIPHKDIDY